MIDVAKIPAPFQVTACALRFHQRASEPCTPKIPFRPAMLEQDLMQTTVSAQSPMLLEQFLEYAIEVEADALCDSRTVYVPAIMEI